MIGGLKKNTSLLALAATGLFVAAMPMSAQAADLGGDCCADLEERVADLEKTTARKGNRKVSLTISGWVNTALYFWDDGADSDLYIVSDNGNTLGSRITFAGAATINSDWSAGYNLTVEALVDDVFFAGVNQLDDDNSGGVSTAPGGGLSILYSYMYLKSNTLGTISWGKQSQATDNVSIVDFSGTLFSGNNVVFRSNNMILNNNGASAVAGDPTYGTVLACAGLGGTGIGIDCTGEPANVIKYETPTFGGFSVAASWGENDFWDVAAKYNGDFNGFKVGAAIGYSEIDGDAGGWVPGGTAEVLEIGASIMHTASGIFVSGSWGKEDSAALALGDADSWYVKAGVKQRWNSLGATAIYGEYAQYNDRVTVAGAAALGGTVAADGTEVTRYGVGIHQWIDAASMQAYLKWDHLEVDAPGSDFDGSELDSITLGAVIFF